MSTRQLPDNVIVVVPARDEEETIGGVLKSVLALTKEVLVIDGNSSDTTRNIAEKLGVRVVAQNGRGKGAALRQIISETDKEILVFIDADGSHDANDIPKLIEPVVKGLADIVVGSRILGGSDELDGNWNNFTRMVGSAVITKCTNMRWGLCLTDTQNGFRAVRRSAVLNLNLKSDGFPIEQEMVMKAVKKGYRVIEIASHEFERKGGKLKNNTLGGWRHVLRFLRDII